MLRALKARCPRPPATGNSSFATLRWASARHPLQCGSQCVGRATPVLLRAAQSIQRAPLHTSCKIAAWQMHGTPGKPLDEHDGTKLQDGTEKGAGVFDTDSWIEARKRDKAIADTVEEQSITNFGTGEGMPDTIPLHPFFLESLRGMGQVVLCNSTFTGAAVTAGLLLGDPILAAMAAIGCGSATATARLIGANEEARSAGMLGCNGALVGCAFAVFIGYHPLMLAPMTAVAGSASAVLATGLGSVMSPVPQWQWAFNIVILGLMAAMVAPAEDPPTPPVRFGELDPIAWFSSVMSGISQIFVVDNPYSGAFILAGIAAYSPGAACATFLGSSLGFLTGVFFAKDAADLEAGIWGNNPALTALAISVFFVPLGGAYAALLCGSAIIASLTTMGVKASMKDTTHTPCFTVPFCLVATAAVLLGGRVPGLVRAKIPHSPEVNLRAFRGW